MWAPAFLEVNSLQYWPYLFFPHRTNSGKIDKESMGRVIDGFIQQGMLLFILNSLRLMWESPVSLWMQEKKSTERSCCLWETRVMEVFGRNRFCHHQWMWHRDSAGGQVTTMIAGRRGYTGQRLPATSPAVLSCYSLEAAPRLKHRWMRIYTWNQTHS